ncbi:DUF2493 domain-containing protein [Jannaschia sp. S6380]|uniref:DUF2493 domain-containing protein n=1 Tax=Jannaschia sp. S6380 TaxID=2926408 RepID=UPI001FF2393F|nr:DUF2493 domain-containing protein [Jannaschia sp. S6380]MCK0166240.1 DUF2493 domain-containing protein [Jannaschia sp. S6380]
MTDHPDIADPAPSATAQVLADLELYGHRPSASEPDPRDCPDDDLAARAAADILTVLVSAMAETALDWDLDELLWSSVNMFHRAVLRIERKLDDNEQAQKRGQREQDGSEVAAVQLETLIEIGQTLLQRRDSMEVFRDSAADRYLRLTGSPWTPRSGSRVNHRHLTAATIDSRDFLSARRRADNKVLIPEGTKIAFAGGMECQDHNRIWAVLDKVQAKHPDMVLLHGGSPRGAELIAAKWAEHRGVTQIAFKPDWSRHAKAAPFKRNDSLLDTLPVGLIVFPGTGITDNLADKARTLGIPLFDFRNRGNA